VPQCRGHRLRAPAQSALNPATLRGKPYRLTSALPPPPRRPSLPEQRGYVLYQRRPAISAVDLVSLSTGFLGLPLFRWDASVFSVAGPRPALRSGSARALGPLPLGRSWAWKPAAHLDPPIPPGFTLVRLLQPLKATCRPDSTSLRAGAPDDLRCSCHPGFATAPTQLKA